MKADSETKQCEAIKPNGERCKRRTQYGDYCLIHQSALDEIAAQEAEMERGYSLVVDEDNYNFIMWLVERPEFDFSDENMVIDWMMRSLLRGNMLYQTKETFNFLHDVWIHENR